MGAPRPSRLAYAARPTALMTAVATLLGALFLCLGPHRTSADTPAFGLAAEHAQTPPSPARNAYTCPYDEDHCALTPVLAAAVLTGPPADAPQDADTAPVHIAPAQLHGRPPRGEAQPRAPDLHVLQVLRT